jgi:hypothetical protein
VDIVVCKTCDELLAAYKNAVRLYSEESSQRLAGRERAPRQEAEQQK